MPSEGSRDTDPAKQPPYTVEMTASAEAVYVDLYRRAKAAESVNNPSSAHCTTFHMVREAVKIIIPGDPLNKRYALRGKLSNVFRIRKGRLRICWIASSRTRRICILFIAQTLRKEGDPRDPYVLFEKLMEAGHFDRVMKDLQLPKPPPKR